MMTLNETLLVGTLCSEVQTSFTATGVQVASCRLLVIEEGKENQQFKTYIPITSRAAGAVALGECDEGALVLIKGKLKWQAGESTDGKRAPGGLVVQAWTVQILAPAPAAVG